MPSIRTLLRVVAAVFALFLYVWYAAVRARPEVKRRRAAKRRAR